MNYKTNTTTTTTNSAVWLAELSHVQTMYFPYETCDIYVVQFFIYMGQNALPYSEEESYFFFSEHSE